MLKCTNIHTHTPEFTHHPASCTHAENFIFSSFISHSFARPLSDCANDRGHTKKVFVLCHIECNSCTHEYNGIFEYLLEFVRKSLIRYRQKFFGSRVFLRFDTNHSRNIIYAFAFEFFFFLAFIYCQCYFFSLFFVCVTLHE